MRNIAELRQAMASSAADQVFMKLYGETKTSKERYLKLIDQFAVDFPDKTEVSVYRKIHLFQQCRTDAAQVETYAPS